MKRLLRELSSALLLALLIVVVCGAMGADKPKDVKGTVEVKGKVDVPPAPAPAKRQLTEVDFQKLRAENAEEKLRAAEVENKTSIINRITANCAELPALRKQVDAMTKDYMERAHTREKHMREMCANEGIPYDECTVDFDQLTVRRTAK